MSMMGSMWGSIPQSAYFGGSPSPTGGQVAGAGAKTAYNPATGRTEAVSSWANGKPQFGGTASQSPSQIISDILAKGTGAVPDSLKSLAVQSTNTLTSTAGVGAPVQAASDDAAKYIQQMIGAGTGTGGDQAQDFIKQMLAGQGPTGTASSAMTKALGPTDTSYLDKGAEALKTHTLADTDMSKYMNPALGAEQAAILHGGDVQNNAIRARQAKSGAFGANSDVAQAQQNENIQRQLGLATKDAYQTASQNALADTGAMNATDVGNRGAVQNVGQEKLGAQLTDQQRALTGGGQINAGALATGNQAWQQYLQKLGIGANLGQAAAGSLGALPGTKTLSQEQLGPSAAGQEIGALIGLTGLQQQYANGGVGAGGNFSSVSK